MTNERTMSDLIDIRKSPGFHGRCYGGPRHLKSVGCMVPYLQAAIPPKLDISEPFIDYSQPTYDVCTYNFETMTWDRDRHGVLYVRFWLAEGYTLTIQDRYQLFVDALEKQARGRR